MTYLPLPATTVRKDLSDTGEIAQREGDHAEPYILAPGPALTQFSDATDVCLWLKPEVPTTSAPRLLIPQQATFWARLGMSQVDPKRSY